MQSPFDCNVLRFMASILCSYWCVVGNGNRQWHRWKWKWLSASHLSSHTPHVPYHSNPSTISTSVHKIQPTHIISWPQHQLTGAQSALVQSYWQSRRRQEYPQHLRWVARNLLLYISVLHGKLWFSILQVATWRSWCTSRVCLELILVSATCVDGSHKYLWH